VSPEMPPSTQILTCRWLSVTVTDTLARPCTVLCRSACRGLGMSDVTETLCIIT